MLAKSGIERRLAHMTFATFPAPRRKSAGDVRRFAEGWDKASGQGLFLQGIPSVGKTGLLIAALHRVVERWADAIPTQELSAATLPTLAARQSVWFTTDAALLKKLRAGFADESFHGLVDHAKSVALLVIDDLGKADYKGGVGWGVEQLYDIIDARYNALLPTWFTTNMGLEQLETRLGENGEAIMDRILDSCEAITITGAKLRMGSGMGATA
jgi:DNA replication protein DnaC